MTWFGWWLIGLLVVRTLLTINAIGKLRTIVTPNEATAALLLNGALIIGILLVGTGHI